MTNDLSKMAAMSGHVILGTFEAELDSLIALAGSESRGGTVEEALIRRLRSDEQLMEELAESMRRIYIKMDIARDRILGDVLQGSQKE